MSSNTQALVNTQDRVTVEVRPFLAMVLAHCETRLLLGDEKSENSDWSDTTAWRLMNRAIINIGTVTHYTTDPSAPLMLDELADAINYVAMAYELHKEELENALSNLTVGDADEAPE